MNGLGNRLWNTQCFMAFEIQLNHLQSYRHVMRYLFLFVKKKKKAVFFDSFSPVTLCLIPKASVSPQSQSGQVATDSIKILGILSHF